MTTGGHETNKGNAESMVATTTTTSTSSDSRNKGEAGTSLRATCNPAEAEAERTSWEAFLKDTKLDRSIVDALKKAKKSRNFLKCEAKSSFLVAKLEDDFPDFTDDHAKKALKILLPGSMESTSYGSHRGVHIADGLDTQLMHGFDLSAFTDRVNELFQWHEEPKACEQFLAPYIALIQSSGMGKTKLFTEFRDMFNLTTVDHHHQEQQQQQQACKTILCVDAKLSKEDEEKYFDHRLLVEDWKANDIVDAVWQNLNTILDKSGVTSGGKLVLLFDEAQGLMHGVDIHYKPSYVFRAIRWWLREQRDVQVVAAFAGTTARLSNFYPPDPPEKGTSRKAKVEYKNYQLNDRDNKELYPPFFELNTISCFRLQKCTSPTKNDETQAVDSGFPMAAIYGRPLFGYYYLHGVLDDAKLAVFAKRLVLSVANYEKNLVSCYSVLGSRVQMGIVNSFHTASDLVSSGYACLVDFQQQKNNKSDPIARVTFMPDPVCATLAMRFMDEQWQQGSLKGQRRRFWVERAEKAFAAQLCLPDKGDAGEIFAALYMLFCGDILRKKKDASLSIFSVVLEKWFCLLKNGGKDRISDVEQAKLSDTLENESEKMLGSAGVAPRITRSRNALDTQTETMIDSTCTVSFVQVCRNDFRANSFCEEDSLAFMYRSGLGSYTYQNCKAFDITSSIEVVQNGNVRYHPLLVSVKNWVTVSKGDVIGWLATMKEFLTDTRAGGGPTAVCLIILLGCSKPPILTGDRLNASCLTPFPAADVFRLVCIPDDDEFGVSEAIQNLGTSSEQTEIYSSHAFMTCEKSSGNLLRKSSKKGKELDALFCALKLSKGGAPESPVNDTKKMDG